MRIHNLDSRAAHCYPGFEVGEIMMLKLQFNVLLSDKSLFCSQDEFKIKFDENGNLIRYDSIYSWSSADNFNALSSLDRDSILQSMQSEFYRNFSHFSDQGFDDVFSSDSLFTNKFFDDAFFKSLF